MEEEFMHEKINEVMHSLDGIKRASPRPFFFTRLEARIQNEGNIWSKLSSLVARPVVAFSCICLLIIINVMVIFLSGNPGGYSTQAGNELAAADEYSQLTSNLYEFENARP